MLQQRPWETLRPAAEAKEIAVSLDAGPDPRVVLGDRDRLQQIIWNLLSNAIKFTPRGGRVSLAVQGKEDEVVLAHYRHGTRHQP